MDPDPQTQWMRLHTDPDPQPKEKQVLVLYTIYSTHPLSKLRVSRNAWVVLVSDSPDSWDSYPGDNITINYADRTLTQGATSIILSPSCCLLLIFHLSSSYLSTLVTFLSIILSPSSCLPLIFQLSSPFHRLSFLLPAVFLLSLNFRHLSIYYPLSSLLSSSYLKFVSLLSFLLPGSSSYCIFHLSSPFHLFSFFLSAGFLLSSSFHYPFSFPTVLILLYL